MRKGIGLLIAVVLVAASWTVAQSGGRSVDRAVFVKLQGALSPYVGRTVSWSDSSGGVWLRVSAEGGYRIERVGEDYLRLVELDRPARVILPLTALKGFFDG